MGRPPLGNRPLTAAEKQRRYRERRAQELAALRKAASSDGASVTSPKADADVRRLRAELNEAIASAARWREEAERLRARLPKIRRPARRDGLLLTRDCAPYPLGGSRE